MSSCSQGPLQPAKLWEQEPAVSHGATREMRQRVGPQGAPSWLFPGWDGGWEASRPFSSLRHRQNHRETPGAPHFLSLGPPL